MIFKISVSVGLGTLLRKKHMYLAAMGS